MKFLLVILTGLIFLLVPIGVSAATSDADYEKVGEAVMEQMMGTGSGAYAIMGWLTWVLVVVALLLGIVWLWKQIQKK